MSFDPAVTLVSLNFGKANGTLGEAATASMSVTPVFTGTRYLNWSATGNPWIPNGESVTATPGSFGTMSVPAVDQSGWVDEFGNAYKNWYYTVTVTYQVGGSSVTLNRNFYLLAGTGPIDVDVTLSSGTSTPQIVLAYPVKTVNGVAPDSTGNITVSGGGSGGATINDTTPSTTTVFSSSKTNTVATAAASALISDTATDTTHVLSASKTIALIGSGGGATTSYPTTALRGVNEAGYDFVNSTSPRTDNTTAPSNASILYAAKQGATMIRVPFLWEYLQPTPLGAFNSTFQTKLVNTITYARSLGLVVNVDCHNYARYMTSDGVNHPLGDGTFVQAWLTDLWTRLAAIPAIGGDNGVHFGLMNEPHDLPTQQGTLGTEMFTNTGFESNITGWTAGNSATLAQSNAQAHTGTYSLSITAGSNTGPQAASAYITIDPTKAYQVSYWARAAATARQTFVIINFSGASGYISTITPSSGFITDTTTGWTQGVVAQADIVIPSNATSMNVVFAVNGAASGEVHYIDDVSLKTSTGGLSGAQVWEQSVQTLVTAIRNAGYNNRIYWGGYNYSAAGSFWANHPTFIPNDPIGNTWPEAHYYADGAGSGTLSYAQTVTYAQGKGATATSQLDALKVLTYTDLTNFLQGARNRGLKGYIGEIGWFQSTAAITAAGNTPAGNELALWSSWGDYAYQIFDAFEAAVTYWSAGDAFAAFSYAYSIYLSNPTTGPNNTKGTSVSSIVEAHYSKAGALNATFVTP